MEMQPYHLLVGIGMALVIGILFLIWGDRPNLAEHLRQLFAERSPYDMSSAATDNDADRSTQAVHVPIPLTSTNIPTAQPVPPAAKLEKADTTAAEDGTDNWTMPPASRHLSERQLIIFLAMQKTPAGKDRFSANKIYELVGGSRAEALRIIKELREGLVELRPLSPEQQATREALGLDRP
jgi:hypothetical protein